MIISIDQQPVQGRVALHLLSLRLFEELVFHFDKEQTKARAYTGYRIFVTCLLLMIHQISSPVRTFLRSFATSPVLRKLRASKSNSIHPSNKYIVHITLARIPSHLNSSFILIANCPAISLTSRSPLPTSLSATCSTSPNTPAAYSSPPQRPRAPIRPFAVSSTHRCKT